MEKCIIKIVNGLLSLQEKVLLITYYVKGDKKWKSLLLFLLTGVLLLGGISFGGDEEIISSLESINPEKIVSYAEESW